MSIIQTDIIILGGGIAGLWTLNLLKTLGYSVILLEAQALGNGQTIKSQGIIHGGMKYALQGLLSPSANSIESMPQRWKASLSGNGELDLRNVKLLSDHQLLFSTGSLRSDLLNFFGSFALNTRVKKLIPSELPLVLQNPQFKGYAYRLNEIVLDVSSLLSVLAKPHWDNIYKIDPNNLQIVFNGTDVEQIIIHSNTTNTITIKAKKYLFLAGSANEILTQSFTKAPKMQLRPLQMVYAKFSTPMTLFGHCIDSGVNPRITITSHIAKDGRTVWYMGGQIAEEGAKRSQAEQIYFAQQEFQSLFPWIEKQSIQWGSFYIDRAEPKQPDGKRPNTVFIKTIGNTIIAWPTKLALSPVLGDEIKKTLQTDRIIPNSTVSVFNLPLEKPAIALAPWDDA